MDIVEFHVQWSSGVRYIAYSSPSILPTATNSWGCAVYLEKPVYPHYTTFFEKQSFEYCEELLGSNDDYYEGFNEVGNQDPGALSLTAWSQKRLVAAWKHENSLIEIAVTCLCGGFLGIEFPGYNKLTSLSIGCHMLQSCVGDTLARAKESPGGWHCCGPATLKASW